jgi:hypothetical protein
MQIFRCYALNERGSIVAGEYIEGTDLPAVIEAGWTFVRSYGHDRAETGLEVWQGSNRLFSTCPANGPDYRNRPPAAGASPSQGWTRGLTRKAA